MHYLLLLLPHILFDSFIFSERIFMSAVGVILKPVRYFETAPVGRSIKQRIIDASGDTLRAQLEAYCTFIDI